MYPTLFWNTAHTCFVYMVLLRPSEQSWRWTATCILITARAEQMSAGHGTAAELLQGWAGVQSARRHRETQQFRCGTNKLERSWGMWTEAATTGRTIKTRHNHRTQEQTNGSSACNLVKRVNRRTQPWSFLGSKWINKHQTARKHKNSNGRIQ